MLGNRIRHTNKDEALPLRVKVIMFDFGAQPLLADMLDIDEQNLQRVSSFCSSNTGDKDHGTSSCLLDALQNGK